ncbi:MAG: hypothetical protein QOJ89_4793 [bacterium]
MGAREPRRLAGSAAGLVLAAGVVVVVLHARGGDSYEVKFGTAFSDAAGLALIAAAVVAATLLAGVRWAIALLVWFAALVLVLGVAHPCRIAFEDTPQFGGCSVSAVTSALGLYLPASALVCAAAGALAARLAVRACAALAGAAATAVLVALFAPWYRASDEGRTYADTGWQVFQRFDVYLAVTALLALVLAAASLRGRANVASRLAPVVALLAVSGGGLAFYRLFTAADAPSSGYVPLAAAYIALGGIVALAFATIGLRRIPSS